MNPDPEPQLTHLRALAGELRACGLRAELGGIATASPYLTVTSQHGATPTERILCQQAPDQHWQFCWTWQQPIGPASNPAAAAAAIADILRPVENTP
jgi:hypothetical protein